jgi:hypothetical protein
LAPTALHDLPEPPALPDFSANLNNPLSIRHNTANDWLGQVGQRNGFVVFETARYGLRAGLILLRTYRKRGADTPRKVLRWYLGAGDNLPRYERELTRRGIALDVAFDAVLLAEALVFMETSVRLPHGWALTI